MLSLDEVKKLEETEAEQRRVRAEAERLEAAQRHTKHLAWLKNERFPIVMQQVDEAISEAVKAGKKRIRLYVGDDESGKFVSELVVKEAEAHGYKALSESEWCPADSGTPTEGYYGHDACWTYDVVISW
jgi:hypothetical protein